MHSVLWKPRYKEYSTVVHTLEGTTISHYQVQQCLARGGMSEVYLAHDTRTKQIVAIKLVHRINRDHVERLQREIKALRALRHENTLPVLAHGKHGTWHYMVIPYIEYGTLAKRIMQGQLTQEEAGNILTQLGSALQFAHERGMIHRDIKPANVLLDNKHHVYLIDFGLVQLQGEKKSNLTPTNQLLGTPEYMAPELTEGPATVSSDVYALGVLLYQMLTGHVPFKGEHPIATIWKHQEEQPAPPSSLNPAITPTIEMVILQALEKRPQHRFQRANDLTQAYQRALGGGEIQYVETRALPSMTRLSPYSGQMRHVQRMIIGLLAATFLALMSLFLGFSFSSFQGQARHLTLLEAHGTNKVLSAVPTSPPVPTSSPMPTLPTSSPMPTLPAPTFALTPTTPAIDTSDVSNQPLLLMSQSTPPDQGQSNKNMNTGQKNGNNHRDNGRDRENCNSHGDDGNNE